MFVVSWLSSIECLLFLLFGALNYVVGILGCLVMAIFNVAKLADQYFLTHCNIIAGLQRSWTLLCSFIWYLGYVQGFFSMFLHHGDGLTQPQTDFFFHISTQGSLMSKTNHLNKLIIWGSNMNALFIYLTTIHSTVL